MSMSWVRIRSLLMDTPIKLLIQFIGHGLQNLRIKSTRRHDQFSTSMVCYLSYLNFLAMLTVSMDVTNLLTSSSPERDDVNKCMLHIPYDLINIFSDPTLSTKILSNRDSSDSLSQSRQQHLHDTNSSTFSQSKALR